MARNSQDVIVQSSLKKMTASR